mgnify:CR=1 FL=1
MNIPKVTETLQEHGISHTMIAPHVIRVAWLVDGASQPVIDFDAKHNFIRKLERFNEMRGVDKGKLRVVMDSCKFKNVN